MQEFQTCPHCGKSFSGETDSFIHCGGRYTSPTYTYSKDDIAAWDLDLIYRGDFFTAADHVKFDQLRERALKEHAAGGISAALIEECKAFRATVKARATECYAARQKAMDENPGFFQIEKADRAYEEIKNRLGVVGSTPPRTAPKPHDHRWWNRCS